MNPAPLGLGIGSELVRLNGFQEYLPGKNESFTCLWIMTVKIDCGNLLIQTDWITAVRLLGPCLLAVILERLLKPESRRDSKFDSNGPILPSRELKKTSTSGSSTPGEHPARSN